MVTSGKENLCRLVQLSVILLLVYEIGSAHSMYLTNNIGKTSNKSQLGFLIRHKRETFPRTFISKHHSTNSSRPSGRFSNLGIYGDVMMDALQPGATVTVPRGLPASFSCVQSSYHPIKPKIVFRAQNGSSQWNIVSNLYTRTRDQWQKFPLNHVTLFNARVEQDAVMLCHPENSDIVLKLNVHVSDAYQVNDKYTKLDNNSMLLNQPFFEIRQQISNLRSFSSNTGSFHWEGYLAARSGIASLTLTGGDLVTSVGYSTLPIPIPLPEGVNLNWNEAFPLVLVAYSLQDPRLPAVRQSIRLQKRHVQIPTPELEDLVSDRQNQTMTGMLERQKGQGVRVWEEGQKNASIVVVDEHEGKTQRKLAQTNGLEGNPKQREDMNNGNVLGNKEKEWQEQSIGSDEQSISQRTVYAVMDESGQQDEWDLNKQVMVSSPGSARDIPLAGLVNNPSVTNNKSKALHENMLQEQASQIVLRTLPEVNKSNHQQFKKQKSKLPDLLVSNINEIMFHDQRKNEMIIAQNSTIKKQGKLETKVVQNENESYLNEITGLARITEEIVSSIKEGIRNHSNKKQSLHKPFHKQIMSQHLAVDDQKLSTPGQDFTISDRSHDKNLSEHDETSTPINVTSRIHNRDSMNFGNISTVPSKEKVFYSQNKLQEYPALFRHVLRVVERNIQSEDRSSQKEQWLELKDMIVNRLELDVIAREEGFGERTPFQFHVPSAITDRTFESSDAQHKDTTQPPQVRQILDYGPSLKRRVFQDIARTSAEQNSTDSRRHLSQPQYSQRDVYEEIPFSMTDGLYLGLVVIHVSVLVWALTMGVFMGRTVQRMGETVNKGEGEGRQDQEEQENEAEEYEITKQERQDREPFYPQLRLDDNQQYII